MADLTPRQTRALAYWGPIEHAVGERATTADIWAAIRQSSGTSKGEPIGFNSADLSVVRAYAARIRNAADTLAGATGNQGVTAGMVAEAPWARPLAERNTLPMWQVRFEHATRNAEGVIETAWRTAVYTGSLAPTVDDLASDVEGDAIGIAAEYNVAHVGISSLQVLAV